jgi:hypothetical protein
LCARRAGLRQCHLNVQIGKGRLSCRQGLYCQLCYINQRALLGIDAVFPSSGAREFHDGSGVLENRTRTERLLEPTGVYWADSCRRSRGWSERNIFHEGRGLRQFSIQAVQACAFYSFMVCELLLNIQAKLPLEAVQQLLQAVNFTNKSMPLLSALLTERAAVVCLVAGQSRKYVLHELTAGLRLHGCGPRPQKHSLVCFALTLLLLDNGSWGAAKAKLAKFIADDWRATANAATSSSQDNEKPGARALVLLLRVLCCALDSAGHVCGKDTAVDAVRVLRLLCEGVGLGVRIGDSTNSAHTSVTVIRGWDSLPFYDILLRDLAVVTGDSQKQQSADNSQNPLAAGICVHDLAIPSLDRRRMHMLLPFNGFANLLSYPDRGNENAGDKAAAIELSDCLNTEIQWRQAVRNSISDIGCDSLIERLVKFDADKTLQSLSSKKNADAAEMLLGLGEPLLINIYLTNKLACELHLSNLALEMSEPVAFVVEPMSLNLGIGESREVQLKAIPKLAGTYSIEAVSWQLSNTLSVYQPLRKDAVVAKATKSRNAQISGFGWKFSILPASALLRLRLDGLSPEVLAGELVSVSLVLANEGKADAVDVCIKTSMPGFVFPSIVTSSALDANLQGSCTVFALDDESSSVRIKAGEQFTLKGWLRLNQVGIHSVSILANYRSQAADSSRSSGFGGGDAPRTSCETFKVC